MDLTGVPYAYAVLTALPENMHPLVLNDSFTKPTWVLGTGYPVSVREWLLGGGDPAPVLLYAEWDFLCC